MSMIKAYLESMERLTDRLGIFNFRPDERIEFTPGQYITLNVSRPGEKGVSRAYSVASAPWETYPDGGQKVGLYVAKIEKGGRNPDGTGMLTSQLFDDTINLEYSLTREGKGHFTLPDDDRDVIMVSTGTGIAPFVSMQRDAEHKRSRRRLIVVHGVSNASDLAYQQEMQSSLLLLTYIPVVSRDSCTNCRAGYVGELFMNREGTERITFDDVKLAIADGRTENVPMDGILRRHFGPGDTVIMLCGNPVMVRNIGALAANRGYNKENGLFVENYWPEKRGEMS